MKAMNSVAKKSLLFFVVTITLFFALGFAFMPMCENIEWLRPQFVLLVLFAWCLVAPRYVNLTMAFFLGLILDLLYGTSLGENAIALVLCTYFVIKFEFAILRLDFLRSGLIIFAVLVFGQLVPSLMQIFLGQHANFLIIVPRALISALIWPLILQFIIVVNKLVNHH